MSDTRLDDFVSELKKQVKSAGLNINGLRSSTMSNGMVNFMYKDWQIGRVYFRKKVSRMQIIHSEGDRNAVKWLNGKPFDEYLSHIPECGEYAKHLEDTEDFLKDFTEEL